ncbi:hypothetical protein BGZ83_009892 [Gryganskiella cystojenkinii]|nr:hypothetical protein BGZ83_009892 [Gryganskiella cystojenkinii]
MLIRRVSLVTTAVLGTALCATSANASLIGNLFTFISTVFTDVTGILGLTGAPAPDITVLYAYAGFPTMNGAANGWFPIFTITNAAGARINHQMQGGILTPPGANTHRNSEVEINAQHVGLTIQAGDTLCTQGARGGETCAAYPMCATYFSILPSTNAPNTDPYVVFADELVVFDKSLSWYHSGETVHVNDPFTCNVSEQEMKCVWFSHYASSGATILDTIQITNVQQFIDDSKNSPAMLMSSSYTTLTHATGSPCSTSRGACSKVVRDVSHKDKFPKVMVHSELSALQLCKSKTSYGPSFLSLKESTLCDMEYKVAYSPCSSKLRTGCYDHKGANIVLVPKVKSRQDSLGSMLSQLQNETYPVEHFGKVGAHKPPQKRCTPSTSPYTSKNSISSGQQLNENQGLYSADGSHIFLHPDGNLCMYDKKGKNNWCLGSVAGAGSPYKAYLETNGAICVYDSADHTQRCTGGSDNIGAGAYHLYVEDNGHAYVFNPQFQYIFCAPDDGNCNTQDPSSGGGSGGGSLGSACTLGFGGQGNGKGPVCACCSSQSDCEESCAGGVCTDSKGNTPGCGTSAGGGGGASCTSGYSGTKTGNGPNGACCVTESDCNNDCTKGICNGS